MQRNPLRLTPPRGRLALALLLVSALAAFASFPVLAQAEDSSGIQYTEVAPTATGKQPSTGTAKTGTPVTEAPKSTEKSGNGQGKTNASQGSNPKAKASTNPSTSETSSEEQGTSSPGGGTNSGGSNNSGGNGNGNGHGSGQGNPPKSGNKVAVAAGQEASLAPTSTLVANHEEQGGGGSSSPVLPIVIIVVVLAALSVGVVMMKRRRQGDGDVGSFSSETH